MLGDVKTSCRGACPLGGSWRELGVQGVLGLARGSWGSWGEPRVLGVAGGSWGVRGEAGIHPVSGRPVSEANRANGHAACAKGAARRPPDPVTEESERGGRGAPRPPAGGRAAGRQRLRRRTRHDIPDARGRHAEREVKARATRPRGGCDRETRVAPRSRAPGRPVPGVHPGRSRAGAPSLRRVCVARRACEVPRRSRVLWRSRSLSKEAG